MIPKYGKVLVTHPISAEVSGHIHCVMYMAVSDDVIHTLSTHNMVLTI